MSTAPSVLHAGCSVGSRRRSTGRSTTGCSTRARRTRPGIDGALVERRGPDRRRRGATPTSARSRWMTSRRPRRRSAEAGGEQVVDRQEIPDVGQLSYFKDTEGNIFGALQPGFLIRSRARCRLTHRGDTRHGLLGSIRHCRRRARRARASVLRALVRGDADPRGARDLQRPVPPRGGCARARVARAAPAADGELREHLEEHAAEETAHIELWDRFVAATGGSSSADATPESVRCAAAWEGTDRDVLATLVALYAIESAQPKISAVKQQGLVDLYGFEEGPATDYFDVHATLDADHAAAHREFIEPASRVPTTTSCSPRRARCSTRTGSCSTGSTGRTASAPSGLGVGGRYSSSAGFASTIIGRPSTSSQRV